MMQWFKHSSTFRFEPKVRRLIRRFGVDGYGLLCYILESTAAELNRKNLIPCLLDSIEDLAYELKMEDQHVEDIFLYLQELGFIQVDSNTEIVIVPMLVELLDEYFRKIGRKEEIQLAITTPDQASSPSSIRRLSGDLAQEETRSKKNKNMYKIENLSDYSEGFEEWWTVYPKKVGKGEAYRTWCLNVKRMPPLRDHIEIVKSWIRTNTWTQNNGQFIPNPTRWILEARWDDEITPLNQMPGSLTKKIFLEGEKDDC